jgi:hypothetical protein
MAALDQKSLRLHSGVLRARPSFARVSRRVLIGVGVYGKANIVSPAQAGKICKTLHVAQVSHHD